MRPFILRPSTPSDGDGLFDLHLAATGEVVVESDGRVAGVRQWTWHEEALYVDRVELLPEVQGRGRERQGRGWRIQMRLSERRGAGR